ncbi:hypothetical protein IL252_16885 [Halomicrobium sp. IBSBa]|uniref:hypothetical protein n=1 Tax=Halomicrobium sp. IBSBa TaxID=2778916 RepID=UPI001ABF29AC|nr:hypothetical protein [Halomicrobium sp. IBSBa]MBO4249485.1 hypothetical protein [Halomicrobium sp. IBSBa]
MNSAEYRLLAKNNLIVAKLLGAVVALAQLYSLPRGIFLGVLVVAIFGFSTASTIAWMSQ